MKLQDLNLTVEAQRRLNAANWHGEQAVKAYRRKDMGAFVRHTQIADHLWSTWG
jgi:hypothetical protein